jgi:hypothetical protein
MILFALCDYLAKANYNPRQERTELHAQRQRVSMSSSKTS